jgi:hypothetical protein
MAKKNLATTEIFRDRRGMMDRRALFNMDVAVANDRRCYRDRRNYRHYTDTKEWWLQVNYVESDVFLVGV